MKKPKIEKLYVIDWKVNNKTKETINLNNPKNFVLTKIDIDRLSSQYKPGKLVYRCINVKEHNKSLPKTTVPNFSLFRKSGK